MKLLLRKHGIGSAPGDILVMTAAVESLTRQKPDYEISVQTDFHELWFGNPGVKHVYSSREVPLGFDREVVVHYDLIHGAQERGGSQLDPNTQSPGCNFVQAFTWGLGKALGEWVGVLRNTPVVYLTKEDQNWLGAFRKEHGEGPFVLLSPSIKRDTTVKAWPVEYYQAVIDHFQGRATFLQLGDPGCMGCELTGVVNLVGQTSLRAVLALASKAKAAVGPVTYLLHACAAFGTPYVCVAGGREQPSWIPYPNVQYLHTMGELDCCNKIACWKQRVIPLPPLPWGQSAEKLAEEEAQNKNLCRHPVLGMKRPVGQCMHDIKPEQVITILERHAKNWSRSVSISQLATVPEPEQWKGLGDVVAAGTKLLGIKPCKGCKDRQETLNRWIPFRTKSNTKRRPYLQRRHGMLVRKRMAWDKEIVDEQLRDNYQLRMLPECKRIVDVGAHIGSFALQCLGRWDAEVVCVEPNIRNIPLLALNTKGLPVEIWPAAMCYEAQPILHNSVYYGPGHSGGSSLVPELKSFDDRYRLKSEVPTCTLEAILESKGWEGLDLLKLDCEGSEFDILRNAKLINVRQIVGEYHNPDEFYQACQQLPGKWRVDVLSTGPVGLFRMTNVTDKLQELIHDVAQQEPAADVMKVVEHSEAYLDHLARLPNLSRLAEGMEPR